MKIKIVIFCFVMLQITACSMTHKQSGILSPEADLIIAETSPNSQATYIKTRQSDTRMCTETDVDYSQTGASGFSLGKGVEAVGEESSKGALALGGRDPAVLLARELMFRACEFIVNTNADQRLALKVYAGTLDSIVRISEVQQSQGTDTLAASTSVAENSPATNTSTKAASSKSSSGTTAEKASSPGFDWSYNWDYQDDKNSIDTNHP